MSLRERVFGLETEYAINFYPADPLNQPKPYVLVGALQEVVRRKYGLPDCDFLCNGGKLHYDVDHIEWAIPECRSAWEATCYDKALDALLAQALPEAQTLLDSVGCVGTLFVAKNNVDQAHNTYGCHENYMMVRDTPLLVGDDFRYYLVRCLTPFLVTRQLFAGAGRVELFHRGTSEMHAHFVLSQRASFIEAVTSQDTRQNRSIIHFGREDEPLAEGNHRRLHLILGDSNLSGWATWLKLGTTAIVLRMIEDLFLQDIPLLLDPVGALHAVADDLTCNMLLPLRDGRRSSARNIQQWYCELANLYLEQYGASTAEWQVLEAWQKALEDLGRDPMKLTYGADWAMKKRIMDAFLEQQRVPWYKTRPKAMIEELQALDLRYHDIGPGGLFNRFCAPDTLLAQEDIERAQLFPPPYTRARVRGTMIQRARQENRPLKVNFWMKLAAANVSIELPDPLAFDQPTLAFDKTWWEQTLAHSEIELRIRALRQLAWRREAESLELLMEQAAPGKETRIRHAAIQGLGIRADRKAMEFLVSCLNEKDIDPMIRWAAEEACESVQKGVPVQPQAIRSSAPAEKDVLIQLLS